MAAACLPGGSLAFSMRSSASRDRPARRLRLRAGSPVVRDQVRPRLALHLRLALSLRCRQPRGHHHGALANVRFPGGETADAFDSTVVDDVDNVLWLQKFALEDTAVKYLATTMNEYTQATESVLKAALRALVKPNDSWKNLDRAIRNTVCIDGRIGCDRTPH